MDANEQARRYFEAWNVRDSDAVAAKFSDGGTYQDPATGGPLTGDAIASYARTLFDAFPDLVFEVEPPEPSGPGRVVAPWVMRGTMTGSLRGLPPTGRTIALPGADLIQLDGGGIRSVRGFFDMKTFFEQAGFQVTVQPHQVGPHTFGAAARSTAAGVRRPGAFSITLLHHDTIEESDKTSAQGGPVLKQFLTLPGFISALTGRTGLDNFTVSAWESLDAMRAVLEPGPHRDALREWFQAQQWGSAGLISTWVEHRSSMYVRCRSCLQLTDAHKSSVCSCGESLPEIPTYCNRRPLATKWRLQGAAG